jgi:hypothetical protein
VYFDSVLPPLVHPCCLKNTCPRPFPPKLISFNCSWFQLSRVVDLIHQLQTYTSMWDGVQLHHRCEECSQENNWISDCHTTMWQTSKLLTRGVWTLTYTYIQDRTMMDFLSKNMCSAS